MTRIAVLSSDTIHHRYLINSLIKNAVEPVLCIFETTHAIPPFPTGPLFEDEEIDFEKKHFFKNIGKDLPNGIIHEVETVNSVKSLEIIKQNQPDFGIVFGTGLIKKNVIELFKDGLINVHRGIAQKYRGLDSDLWAIYHRDFNNIGVTIHKVDPTLDTGDIVYQETLELKHGMKIYQIRYFTTIIATELITKAVDDYLRCEIEYKGQNELGRYYSFMPLDLKKMVSNRFNEYCGSLK